MTTQKQKSGEDLEEKTSNIANDVEDQSTDESVEDQKAKQRMKHTSLLFEPIPLAILAGCLFLAIWFKATVMIGMVSFLLLLALFIFLWKTMALKNIDVTLDVPKTRLFVGDNFSSHMTVKNNKWLPLVWLEWEFSSVNKHLIIWNNEQRENYLIRFLWLMAYQTASFEVTGAAKHRGVYPIGHVNIRSGDGFRFSEKETSYDLNKQLFIYPKMVPVRVPNIQLSTAWKGEGRQGGFMEDPLLVGGIRDYEAGDEWRRLNWRASARTGSLQTNIYQPVVTEELMVLVDIENFLIDENKFDGHPEKREAYRKQKRASFEEFLSITSSVMLKYHEQGVSVGYISNAKDDQNQEQRAISPQKNITLLLDQFAKMTQQTAEKPKDTLLAMHALSKEKLPVIIFCEQLTKAHVQWYQAYGQHQFVRFYYVSENEFAQAIGDRAKSIYSLMTSH